MTSGVRAQRRAQIEARLLEVGRAHLATHGAAALSIRAVARDMDMTPSALFRYIDGRDGLLTLLIVDGYSSLADTVEAALTSDRATAPNAPPARQWKVFAHAVRDWALAHPHQWSLLYGSPVPDYAAPAEQTNPAGNRTPLLLAAIGLDAVARGSAAGPTSGARSGGRAMAARATRAMRREAGGSAYRLPSAPLANGLVAWQLLIGAVSTEVFEGLGPNPDAAALFDYTVAVGRAILFTD